MSKRGLVVGGALVALGASVWMVPQAFELRGEIGLKPNPAQVNATLVKPPREVSPAIKAVTVLKGLDHPWSLAFLPQGGMLITERAGALNYSSTMGAVPLKVSGLPSDIAKGGQMGLFDVVLAPDFAQTQQIVLSYASQGRAGNVLKVATAKLDVVDRTPTLSDVRVIFTSTPDVKDNKNLGGKMLFLPDGTLLVSVGDFFDQDESQNLGNHLGKVMRINRDGSVPKDNPMAGRTGVKPEIFTYGNRNIQGLALRPGTQEIWSNEHGPRGGDEVNMLAAGKNYGIDYSSLTITSRTTLPGAVDPLTYWVPSIAPSGMAFYTGDVAQWTGDAFIGSLVATHLRRLDIEGGKIVGEEILLKDLGERIRDVRMGPDGYLYILTDENDGKLIRVEPAR